MAKRLTALLLMSACTACGPTDPETRLVVRSERNGVGVIENLDAALEAVPTWIVGPVPELSIGVAQGPEELQLFGVMDAVLAGERIVVVNAGTRELRWFDRRGEFLEATGGAGQGPGEFGFPLRVWVLDDLSIDVWDPALLRLSTFDPGGQFDDTVVPDDPPGGSAPDMVALFADDHFVLASWRISPPDEGFAQSTLELSLHAPGGERVDTLGSWPNGRMGRVDPFPTVSRYIFDPNAHATGSPHALWVGNAGEPEVVRFTASGRRELIVRWPAANRAVEPRHIDAYYRASAENDPEDAALDEQRRGIWPVAERFPEYGDLVVATSGELWVMRYQPPGEEGDAAWLVFGETGVLTARAATPAGFTPFEIGDDYLLGAIDDAGFERVVMYGIRRNGMQR